MLCKYRDALGKPNEGFHKTRFFGLAANDLIGTIVITLGISYYTGYSLILVILVMLIFTILIHRVFCVNTTLNKAIFGEI